MNEWGQISLDKPLTIAKHSRVRVIVLITEENEEDDEVVESADESFRQGWYDTMTGNPIPVSQLREGIDPE